MILWSAVIRSKIMLMNRENKFSLWYRSSGLIRIRITWYNFLFNEHDDQEAGGTLLLNKCNFVDEVIIPGLCASGHDILKIFEVNYLISARHTFIKRAFVILIEYSIGSQFTHLDKTLFTGFGYRAYKPSIKRFLFALSNPPNWLISFQTCSLLLIEVNWY